MQGTFGVMISTRGGVGNLPPGGGPGTTLQSTTGRFMRGGMMTGTTVALGEPSGMVVIH